MSHTTQSYTDKVLTPPTIAETRLTCQVRTKLSLETLTLGDFFPDDNNVDITDNVRIVTKLK